VLILVADERAVRIWRFFAKAAITGCGKILAKARGTEYNDIDYSNQGFVFSDDLFRETNFKSLVDLY
jgi:hypothetical protein